MCKEEFLALAQQEDTYGIVIYQVLDGTRRPVNLGLAPSGVRVLEGTIPRAIYQWDSIIKIYTKHKSVNLKICSLHTQHTQRVKFHCPHLHDTKLLAKTIAEMVGYYREYHSRTPETLPRLKRWFSGRHSTHRMQRSVSLRGHHSTKSHTLTATSGGRHFATQSFSGADKMRDRVIHNRTNTPVVVTTQRSISVGGPPAGNGRLLHETGQTLDEPAYSDPADSKRVSRHSGEMGFPDQDHLAVQGVQTSRLKGSPISIDRLTQDTETSYGEMSHESSPPDRPMADFTLETAQVETYSRSHDVHPRYSTPKQDVQQNGFHQPIHSNGNSTHITPLHSIPEKTRGTLCTRPEYRSRSSPMLQGTRFSSESSIQRQLRTITHSPESNPNIIYRSKRGRGSVASEVTNSLLLNRPSSTMLPEVPCDESYLDSHIRSILFDSSQREETSTEF